MVRMAIRRQAVIDPSLVVRGEPRPGRPKRRGYRVQHKTASGDRAGGRVNARRDECRVERDGPSEVFDRLIRVLPARGEAGLELPIGFVVRGLADGGVVAKTGGKLCV